jgi:hypothetical protein
VEGAGPSSQGSDPGELPAEVCAQWVLEETPPWPVARAGASDAAPNSSQRAPAGGPPSSLLGLHCRIVAPPAPSRPFELVPQAPPPLDAEAAALAAGVLDGEAREPALHSRALELAGEAAAAAAAAARADLEESLAPDGSPTTAVGPSCIGVRGGRWRLEACRVRAGRRADVVRVGKGSAVGAASFCLRHGFIGVSP